MYNVVLRFRTDSVSLVCPVSKHILLGLHATQKWRHLKRKNIYILSMIHNLILNMSTNQFFEVQIYYGLAFRSSLQDVMYMVLTVGNRLHFCLEI